ncbi:MAG: uroporphyrinogen decarboxylase family protein [Sedimentisphaerales bacterium]|nr:uroporphyrinogen decarboxylase family protein [Sedimentisphaerales bacterium]
MTDKQWQQLLAVLSGQVLDPLPCAFIIDCPWLPGWYGTKVIDYLADEQIWFDANRKAVETFPQVWFLPGFWAEYGMCTEPSAFGATCQFPEDGFPSAKRSILRISDIDDLEMPDPRTDGLLPFVIQRLRWARPQIEDLGHRIRFSVSRGPLNIASFLMGTTEFLMAIKTDPGPIHKFLGLITEFLKQWHQLQRDSFASIDGIMILDDVVGFIGPDDFAEFAFPYLQALFADGPSVRFFHNDAPCSQSIAQYSKMGVNLYNPGSNEDINQLRKLAGDRITILGNIPARDILAQGTPDQVRQTVKQMLQHVADKRRWIPSCGGGMPPDVTTDNIRAFVNAVQY